jgi:hypothetical protein
MSITFFRTASSGLNFQPFHSLYFPLRGHGWRGKGRNSDVIHHCNRRYRLAKRQTCRASQRTSFMQKAHTRTHAHTHKAQVHSGARNHFVMSDIKEMEV